MPRMAAKAATRIINSNVTGMNTGQLFGGLPPTLNGKSIAIAQYCMKNPTPAPQCTLKQAPTLYGIQLGMSVEQVLSLFNGSSSDADVRRMLERVKVSGRFGLMDLQIIPSRYSSESKYADIKVITLKFLDGHAFSIDVIYNGPRWKSTDEFISSMSDSLGLPAPDAWEALLPLHSKYLRCVGFEIWFFASPGGIGNKIDLIDLAAEKTLTDRQAAEGK